MLHVGRLPWERSRRRSMDAEVPGSPGHGKAKLEDVARLARVSRSTASRVITGSPGVSEAARLAVERAARRLSYSPNRAARSLVTRRTDLIGLVIPEPVSRLFGDPTFPRLIRGVNQELAGRDLQLVLFTPQSERDGQRLERHLTSGQIVDGVLLFWLHGADPLPARLAARGVPVVVSGRPLGSVELSFVDVDNRGGAAAGARRALREAGRSVPGDVALVGFDDSPLAASSEPPLSSVRQPLEEMAEEMTRLLLRAIEGRTQAPRGLLLATRLIPRESSGAAPA